MPVHHDSVYINQGDLGEVRREGAGSAIVCVSNLDVNTVEFVPASAYREAIRGRDAARAKLAESDESHMFLTEENARLRAELAYARATIAQLRTAETERPPACETEEETRL